MTTRIGSIGAKLNPPPATAAPSVRREGAVDMIALAAGLLVAIVGGVQLFIPLLASPLTGLDTGASTQILAALLLTMGTMLAIAGMARIRSLAIYAAELISLTALVAFAVLLFLQASFLALAIFLAMAVMALAASYLARLSDKAEMKRELRFAQAKVQQNPEQTAAVTEGETV